MAPSTAAQLAKLREPGAPSELGLTCDAKRKRRLGGRLQVQHLGVNLNLAAALDIMRRDDF